MKKKGMQTIQIIAYMFGFFFIAIFLGLVAYGFGIFNDVLDQDVMVGQVNLSEANSQSFGKFATGFISRADLIGVVLLLSMVLVMFFNAYFFGSKYPKWFLIIDIVILVFAFITSVYIAQTYQTFIDGANVIDDYVNTIPKTSKFVLNMPKWVATIGVIMMILSYAGLKKDEQSVNVGVYYGTE